MLKGLSVGTNQFLVAIWAYKPCGFLLEFTKFLLSGLVFTAGPQHLEDATMLLQVPIHLLVHLSRQTQFLQVHHPVWPGLSQLLHTDSWTG